MSSPHDDASSIEEPIAVVGMACRLPQAGSPDDLWHLLREGRDAIGPAPLEREARHGEDGGYGRAGYVDGVDRFDAGFFGLSPREAAAADPQQRLALELAWEAMENARIVPDAARGADTAVFIGAIGSDYATMHDRLGAEAVGPHTLTSVQRGIIANRVSYAMGLRGPSLTVDSGQSSSLVAVHLACEELRRGACTTALAGGVNLNLLPETSAVIGRFGALSPDGRSYTFDARANGYVRGEGGALLVLKPLSEALAAGDPVHAVILGGAVNNDGGGEGLTVPDARAQEAVIRAARERAGVRADEVQYVELHGPGTPVGDPVEARALGAAGADGERSEALLVGSVKTNIGHLEGAAGVAGLLKVVLCLKHRRLAPSLNFASPNPAIPLDDLGLDVVREARDWPEPRTRLIAGVSSFGMGGTNCHLVVAEAPARPAEPRPAAPRSGAPWILGARSRRALHGQARALARHLAAHPGTEPADVALSLARTRARFEHRAVLLGEDPADLRSALDALAEGRVTGSAVVGARVEGARALVFPGQGSQWPGMARGLMNGPRPFAERLEQCARALEPFTDYALLDVLAGTPGAPDLSRVDVVQPALWAVMVSLAELWRARGLDPRFVIGHSQGEIAAATYLGALSLEDGARVVALRSRALTAVRGGGMLSVGASEQVVAQRLGGFAGVSVAAVNGPRSVVVAGGVDELTELKALMDQEGYRTKVVPVDYASHSPAVEAVRERILEDLAGIRPVTTPGVFVSTLTGAPIDTARLDARYWFDNLRHPVRFDEAVRHAIAAGCHLFVESSPHPVLAAAVEESGEQADAQVVALGTLRRDEGTEQRVLRSLADAFTAGAPIDWDAYCAQPGARPIDLPTYAFQRERHWLGAARPRHTPAPQEGNGGNAAEPVHAGQDADASAPLSPSEARRLVLDAAADILGHADPAALDSARSFKDLGFDSAGTLELRGRLKGATGLSLPTTLFYDFPTPNRLAAHLSEAAGGGARAAIEPAATSQDPDDDPVVIVGMGCRYPGGADSPQQLWRLVADEVDAISELPADRGWDLDALHGGPGRPGSSATRHGGFVHDADEFDPAFFGISPREAAAMDPQQRLVLETSWESLERAGIDPAGLAGTATGVFVGAMAADYGPRLHQPTGAAEGHLLTGTAASVTSGRVAYAFGFQGPALTVDTACSSSLVAIRLACEALLRGDCTLALAGGVTVMANPGILVEFTRQNGLSGDGRAKAFSAAADGTAFAEGAGMLALERLSAARRAGRTVLAVIRGGAVNQDGASNGLTAPNGLAQQQVIRRALADARLRPEDVDAVEAHGTGTALGDPIEAGALLATYGYRGEADADADRQVWLGSVKSNIGHTQAAAGVAGVIKMVMAMRHGLLPRTLHADEPTTKVDWSAGRVSLLTKARPWVAGERPLRAAVSSFGMSGTNAHLILESAPTAPARSPAAAGSRDAGPLVWVLSAKSRVSLRAGAARLRAFAAEASDAELAAAGPVLARRPAFAHRAVVVAADRDELCEALAAVAEAGDHPAVAVGAAGAPAHHVFVFPGQGSQWAGMGVALLDSCEAFAERLRACDAALLPYTGWSVISVLRQEEGAPPLESSEVVQPALFAVMVSLAELWRSVGVEPAAVIGHSQGEIAAACVAGALSLDEGARVVVTRSRLLKTIYGTGGLIAATLPYADAVERIAPWAGRLWVAVHNGPASTVIGGEPAALTEFEAAWGAEVQLRRAAVDYAAHTPHVEVVREELLAALAGVRPTAAGPAFFSSCTGEFLSGPELTADYWYRNLAEPVRFDTAVRAFADRVNPLFVTCSPHPILDGDVRDILQDAGIDGSAVGSLRRDQGGRRQFLLNAAHAYVAGATVDWTRAADDVLSGFDTHTADLPAYPFEHHRFWLDGGRPTPGSGALGHPMLDTAVPTAQDGGHLLTGRVSRSSAPWLTDHAVHGTVLLPGTAFVELAVQAAVAAGADQVDDVTIGAALALPETGVIELQVSVASPGEDGRRALSVHSRPTGDPQEPWTRHATGVLAATAAGGTPSAGQPTDQWPPAGAERIDLSGAYDLLAGFGYEYGPAFQGLAAAWRTDSARYAEVRLPDAAAGDADAFALHPALLDAALHVLVLDAMSQNPDGGLLLPFSFTGVRVSATGADSLRVRLTGTDEDGYTVELSDAAGASVGRVDALALRRAPAEAFSRPSANVALHGVEWVEAGLTAAAPSGRRWAVVGTGARAERVAADLAALGFGAARHDTPDTLVETPPAVVLVPCETLAEAAAEVPGAVRRGALGAHGLIRRWLADERLAETLLVFLADPGDPVAGPVWGLVRSAQTEHPGRFALVDVAVGGDGGGEGPDTWTLLAAALDADEPQCAVRGGRVLLPRIARRAAHEAASMDLGGGTVLITGGAGGLGALTAVRLAERHGARDLLLVSRRGSDTPGSAELAERLERLGARVRIESCDAGDRAALAALLVSIPADRPLTAVVHAAGALDDAGVEQLRAEQFETVLLPKVDAGWNLHELTAGLPLRAFVLFSSVAGVLGTAGQGNYAAANAFLDALAAHRRTLGLPAMSIAWGLWSTATGMTGTLTETDLARLARAGTAPLPTETGLGLLDAALTSGDEDATAVASVWDLTALRARLADGAAIPAVLRGLVRAPRRAARTAAATTAGSAAAGFAERVAGLDRDAASAAVLDLVRGRVAAALAYPDPGAVDPDRPFAELGFDSLTSVELRNRLSTDTGLRLPTALVFNQPTVTGVAEYLLRELAPAQPAPAEALGEALDRIGALLEVAPPEERGQAELLLAAALGRLRGGREDGGRADGAPADLRFDTDEEIFQFLDSRL
jgi:acyl transferase domain-containing protein